jgi:Do/DeqQ family serine protease
MSRAFRTIIVSVVLVAAFGAAPAHAQSKEAPKVDPHAVLRAMEEAFSSVADRVMPAVVNVSTVPKKSAALPGEDAPEQFREFFGNEFYERYFRRRPREEGRATGSGVIVDTNGYILTNNHVIENAAEISIRLSDGRRFPAKLVGRDPKTDLAVLKVDAPAPLPAATLGDSDALRVGQWAIAIGSPFGLDRTVTVGIISATARSRVGVATYENFIQTDASINPGNSGGPLLNLDGHVIGVNTAIVATGQGIGFSIPINMAKDVMRQLIAKGRVVRGWLGIVIQDVTDELAESFGVKEREGVLVADVMKGGPAEAAGLRAGDVITQFAGSPIKEAPELQRRVAGVAPGQAIPVVVIREGHPAKLTVMVGEMPADERADAGGEVSPDDAWGLALEPLTPEQAQRLQAPRTHGLVITDVAPGSAAEQAGLHRGDVILEANRKPVSDVDAFYKELSSVKPGDGVALYVHRPGPESQNQFVVLARPPKP